MADIDLIRKFENLGVRSINSADCIKTTNDKYLSYLKLSDENIPVPKTYLASHNLEIIEKEIGCPIVIKPIIGAQGKGVILAEDLDILKGLESRDFMVQEYIEYSRGRDIRVFIVGGKAIACVERVGAEDDFRSNFSLGGSVRPYNLTPEIKKIAESTAKALRLEIGGIDLLFNQDGFKVCEANFSPGFETIEKCYNLDIPKIIFNYIKEG
jgi:gamma-F420-2:alpha-L-glutamate ligase